MRNVNGAMLLRFHKWSFAAVTLLGAGLAQNAFAQSSGTEAVEEDMSEVVVSRHARAHHRHRRRPDRAQVARHADGRIPRNPDVGPERVPEPQPDPGRQLHQQRSVRHLGRQPAHPRLRRLARLGDLRRRAAQRLRQLRAVHQPDARLRAHRPRRREPRHDRRRQPHGIGHRRHGGLPHQAAHRRIRRRGRAVGR